MSLGSKIGKKKKKIQIVFRSEGENRSIWREKKTDWPHILLERRKKNRFYKLPEGKRFQADIKTKKRGVQNAMSILVPEEGGKKSVFLEGRLIKQPRAREKKMKSLGLLDPAGEENFN